MISCVMPTRCRPQWVKKAVENWRKQVYLFLPDQCELVIVEDGAPSVKDLAAECGDGVRYYFLGPRILPFGAKRNAANACCCGDIIAHWDDDDWYQTDRLQEQVLLLEAPGVDMVGYRSAHFHDVRSDQVRIYQGGEHDLIDSSLVYRRKYWLDHMYPPVDKDADGQFIRAAKPHARGVTGLGRMVARRHGANTDPCLWWDLAEPAQLTDLPWGYRA